MGFVCNARVVRRVTHHLAEGCQHIARHSHEALHRARALAVRPRLHLRRDGGGVQPWPLRAAEDVSVCGGGRVEIRDKSCMAMVAMEMEKESCLSLGAKIARVNVIVNASGDEFLVVCVMCYVLCYVLCVMCYVLCVTCHMLCVTCYAWSPITPASQRMLSVGEFLHVHAPPPPLPPHSHSPSLSPTRPPNSLPIFSRGEGGRACASRATRDRAG